MVSQTKNLPQHEAQKIKISLKEMPLQKKKSERIKEKIKEPQKAPLMPKGSELKKIMQQPPIKYEPTKQLPKETQLNESKSKPKVEPKPKIEPLPPQKPYIPLLEKKVEQPSEQKDSLYALLSQDKSSEQEQEKKTKNVVGSSINQNIKELYGDEFGKLSEEQQQYILDNQEIMRRITQEVLTRVASVNLSRDLNVNRVNVIEFYLHPNGDMSDFKFLQKSGLYVLDDTTKETIEYAYSRYPRPTEKTLIRYNVFYNLARY